MLAEEISYFSAVFPMVPVVCLNTFLDPLYFLSFGVAGCKELMRVGLILLVRLQLDGRVLFLHQESHACMLASFCDVRVLTHCSFI